MFAIAQLVHGIYVIFDMRCVLDGDEHLQKYYDILFNHYKNDYKTALTKMVIMLVVY